MSELKERLTMSHVYRQHNGEIGREKLSKLTGVKENRCRSFIDAIRERGDIIGVIGDLHLPFEHERYLEHCVRQFTKHGVTRVVNIGDLLDHHRISRHSSEPDALGAMEEYRLAKEKVAEWADAFPYMFIVEGNHCAIPKRQLAEIGLPPIFGRTLEDLYDYPDGWEMGESIIIDDVFYTHGVGSSGMYCAANLMKKMRMSCVQGHIHSASFVHYNANPHSLIFGMAVGSGCDPNSYAFRYSKHSIARPIVSCGIVESSEFAYVLPMRMH